MAHSLKTVEIFETPSEKGLDFRVPQMEVMLDQELRLFDEPEALDYPWSLPLYEASPSDEVLRELKLAQKVRDAGGIDVGETGHMTTRFLQRNLIASQVGHLRKRAVAKECQSFLFGEGNTERVRVGTEYEFEFHPDAYSPDRPYDPAGKYGAYEFEKHFYPRMGDFDSKEEFACACWLDRQPKVKFWVRNLVRKNGMSFFLQKADGRFYPDFICKLEDGRILAVEYKGQNGWGDAKDDRKIGGLWEEMSGGRCLFVMATDKDWKPITEKME